VSAKLNESAKIPGDDSANDAESPKTKLLTQQKVSSFRKNMVRQQKFNVSACVSKFAASAKCAESALTHHFLLSHHKGFC